MTCAQVLREQGTPYPRTCAECGLGPCKLWPPSDRRTLVARLRDRTAPSMHGDNALKDEAADALERTAIMPAPPARFTPSIACGVPGMLNDPAGAWVYGRRYDELAAYCATERRVTVDKSALDYARRVVKDGKRARYLSLVELMARELVRIASSEPHE